MTEDNRLIALDNKFELTPTSLTIKGEISIEDWLDYGRYKLEYVEGALQWWIGDYLNEGERQHGEKFSQAIDESQARSWKVYKWVSSKVQKVTRVTLLSWAHHREVASLKPAEQSRWLQKAIDNHWSKRDLYDAVRDSKRIEPPPMAGKYRIIYADPPWLYEEFGVSVSEYYGGTNRHYPSMTIEEMCALPVKDIAEKDSVLFLWVTSPKLNQVWDVIEAWGFEYKTSFVWDKVRHNYGHYNSVRHEILLVCGHGSSTPDVQTLYDSVQSIERSDIHSDKPEEFRQIIDTLYTHGNKVELFARKAADGWDTWGNE